MLLLKKKITLKIILTVAVALLSVVSGNVVFSKKITVGKIDKAVKEYSSVKSNRVYHVSLLPLFFDNVNEGGYSFRAKGMPKIKLLE